MARDHEALLRAPRDAVERFDGLVDKFTGDGIMALFGAPAAHEDHAARACHAALDMLAGLERFADELRRERGLEFGVRVGLNSGQVVVGAIGSEGRLEYTAVGRSVGLAERMQELAGAGEAYLTHDTAALVRGYFELRDLGELRVKGMKPPVHGYELVGLGRLRTPLERSEAHGLSPFVGRGEELSALESALARAGRGGAEIVGLVGEPGIGKSRLCHEFAARCRERGVELLEAHCRVRGASSPLLPVLELLRAAFGVAEDDPAAAARAKIAARAAVLDETLGDELPLVLDLLGVGDPDRPLPRMSADARQRRTFDALGRIVRARSEREVAVYVIEDLQWIDRGSELFLENLVRAIPGTRTLLVLSFRDYGAPWMRSAPYRQLPVASLAADPSEALVRELLGTDPSLDEVAGRILERAGGNPFFIEELVRGLAEGGSLSGGRGRYRLARPVAAEAIPARVEAVLEARIDRLPEREKGLLETAAVIGREFAEPVLRRVAGLAEPEFGAALATLGAEEFVDQRALLPERGYAFKHQLSRDVAYRSLVAERRRSIHARVAGAIEQAYPERLDELAAVVSHHLEQAGEPLAAARWSSRAAVWAGFMVPMESLRGWQKVRELTDAAGEGEEAVAMGIGARINILRLVWRLGVSHEEVRRVFEEGRALAESSEDPLLLGTLLASYAGERAMLGEAPQHLEMMREAIGLIEQSGDRGIHLVSLTALGWILFTTGRVEEAFEALEQALELAAGDPTVGAGIVLGSPYAWCLTFGAHWGLLLGRLTVQEAFARLDEAGKVGHEQDDLEMVGWADEVRAGIARDAGQTADILPHVERAVRIAERIGDSFSRGMAHGALGRAHLDNGHFAEAITELSQALEVFRSARTALNSEATWLGPLAEAQLGAGNPGLALETAREAVSVAKDRGARFQEIDAQVALARALLGAGGKNAIDEAEAALRSAHRLVEEIGVLGIEVHEELARLAELKGNRVIREKELREAHRRLKAVGADARAARIAKQLSEPVPQPTVSAEETSPDER